MNNLTAIVISFLRPRYTIDCIHSLRQTYPDINIIVGDQADDFQIKYHCKLTDSKYINLPFDYGVGASRNKLIEQADTKYVLVGDDDFFYDKDAKVDNMVKFLESNNDIDLIGGRIFENDQVKDYQGYIIKESDHIRYEAVHQQDAYKLCERSNLHYIEVDLTFNFFVARTKMLKKYPWDENIKVVFEHSHQFIRFKNNNVNVVFSPEPIVKHKLQEYPIDKKYSGYRTRKSDKDYFFNSLDIDYVVSMNGKILHKNYTDNNVKVFRIKKR